MMMKTESEPNELTLNAYVDGQLDPEMERFVLHAMQNDPDICEQVGQLRRAKDWMRAGFADARPVDGPIGRNRTRFGRLGVGIAASLMAIAIGIGGGVVGYNFAERGGAITAWEQDPMRVVLHIDDSEPAHFQDVLDYAENFLEENRDRGTQVEVVANAGGVELMRSGISPFESRVKALNEKYPNLHFVACMNSLRNLRREGINPVMIDDVHTGTTAVDHIVKRLRDGWTYRKVDKLVDT
jgi:intracellular sulfur oxidation DsrE/DsrF family protein